MTCSILQASSTAVFSGTPRLISQEEIVARERVLRDEIDKIIAEIEVG